MARARANTSGARRLFRQDGLPSRKSRRAIRLNQGADTTTHRSRARLCVPRTQPQGKLNSIFHCPCGGSSTAEYNVRCPFRSCHRIDPMHYMNVRYAQGAYRRWMTMSWALRLGQSVGSCRQRDGESIRPGMCELTDDWFLHMRWLLDATILSGNPSAASHNSAADVCRASATRCGTKPCEASFHVFGTCHT